MQSVLSVLKLYIVSVLVLVVLRSTLSFSLDLQLFFNWLKYQLLLSLHMTKSSVIAL